MLNRKINTLPENESKAVLSKLNYLKSKKYGDLLFVLLAQGNDFTISYLKERTFSQIDQNAKFEIPADRKFYHSIACKEITSTGITESKLEGDYFKIYQPNEGSCRGQPLEEPFDSKNYLISKPIYYISGLQDTWTSPKQYSHHIKNQIHSQKKISICDHRHGHEVITLLSNECKQNLFEFIINNTPIKKGSCPTIEVANNVPCYALDETLYSESNDKNISGTH